MHANGRQTKDQSTFAKPPARQAEDEHRFTQINSQKITKDSLESAFKLSSASRDLSSFNFHLPPSPLIICVNPRPSAVSLLFGVHSRSVFALDLFGLG